MVIFSDGKVKVRVIVRVRLKENKVQNDGGGI